MLAFALATPSVAGTTINVKLSDKGGTMDMSKGMGLGIGMHGDMKTAIMSIEIDKKTVKAGVVTFKVNNSSKDTIHELIVSPINNADETLPYLNNENRVDEEHGSHLGEVSELNGGASGALTITLKPGMYALFCNIPNHYMDGMWTLLTVTK
ncbi:MAG: plastocyanin/azurin family copper-binding protein [Pseudomonadota bacterium]|nr:plastocyanin/azurin family copper-binding protein [Pseudomonadota bacterium]